MRPAPQRGEVIRRLGELLSAHKGSRRVGLAGDRQIRAEAPVKSRR